MSTLPLYAYIEPLPELYRINCITMLDIHAPDTTRRKEGCVLSLTGKRGDVVVNDFNTADKLVAMCTYHNDNQDIYLWSKLKPQPPGVSWWTQPWLTLDDHGVT